MPELERNVISFYSDLCLVSQNLFEPAFVAAESFLAPVNVNVRVLFNALLASVAGAEEVIWTKQCVLLNLAGQAVLVHYRATKNMGGRRVRPARYHARVVRQALYLAHGQTPSQRHLIIKERKIPRPAWRDRGLLSRRSLKFRS